MRRPPFCPNKECACHVDEDSREARALARRVWFKRNGYYHTDVRGAVTRFKCLVCGHGFSEQTFSIDYYVKRIIDYETLKDEVCSCSGVRACARKLRCSCDSVSNRTSRFARQCISAHARIIAKLLLAEDLAADGFESFCVSQYFPNNIHTLVGSESQLVYFSDYVTLRRSGRMTPIQKRIRAALEELYRASPTALIDSFLELLSHLAERVASCSKSLLTLNTDKRLEYLRALFSCQALREAIEEHRLIHHRVDSRAARTSSNRLFPVNYIDREFRKDLAEHVRETVRFARNVNHCMERLWIYLLDHNLYKRFRINDPVGLERTHAETAGLRRDDIARATARLTTRRRFLSLESLEPALARVWRREHQTPLKGIVKGALKAIKRHARKGPVDIEAVKEELKVSTLIEDKPQYLPQYALN